MPERGGEKCETKETKTKMKLEGKMRLDLYLISKHFNLIRQLEWKSRNSEVELNDLDERERVLEIRNKLQSFAFVHRIWHNKWFKTIALIFERSANRQQIEL